MQVLSKASAEVRSSAGPRWILVMLGYNNCLTDARVKDMKSRSDVQR